MTVAETFSNAGSLFGRWLRRHLTAEAMLDGLKTGIWVLPLTLLIWVYAEQEKPSNVESQPLQLEIRSATADRIVSVKTSDDVVLVDLDGSKASVEAVKKELNKKGENPAVRIEVPADIADSEEAKISIVAQVSEAEIFKQNRVRVKRVTPDHINVQIVTLRTVDAVVKPAPDAPVVGTPTFVPQTIKLTGPKKLLPEGTPQWVVYAQIPKDAAPSTYEDVPVSLTLPIPGDQVRATPPTVRASYQISQKSMDYAIKGLPLRYSFTGNVYQERIVESNGIVNSLDVYGPPDQIKRIQPGGDFDAYATLKIEREDPIGKTISRTLEYHLPPGVSVKADQATPFDFTLKKPTPPNP